MIWGWLCVCWGGGGPPTCWSLREIYRWPVRQGKGQDQPLKCSGGIRERCLAGRTLLLFGCETSDAYTEHSVAPLINCFKNTRGSETDVWQGGGWKQDGGETCWSIKTGGQRKGPGREGDNSTRRNHIFNNKYNTLRAYIVVSYIFIILEMKHCTTLHYNHASYLK